MSIKYLDKDPQSDVRIRVPEFVTVVPFFGCLASNVPDEVFVVAAAMSRFTRAMGTIMDLGDVLTDDQTAQVVSLFNTFTEESGYAETRKKATSLKLENGRLRAKIKRLEASD